MKKISFYTSKDANEMMKMYKQTLAWPGNIQAELYVVGDDGIEEVLVEDETGFRRKEVQGHNYKTNEAGELLNCWVNAHLKIYEGNKCVGVPKEWYGNIEFAIHRFDVLIKEKV